MVAWQPDIWTAALRATGSDSWAVRRSKAECDAICAAQPGCRVWAFDLGQRDGATNQPKAFIAAATDVFLAAYALLPPEHRHAYEIVDGPCNVFFDLECDGEKREQGDAAAQDVERAAREVVEELAAQQRLDVTIESVAIDSAYPNKFSRHLLLRATATRCGCPLLLRGPREAGDVAARAAKRAGPAVQVIDRAVYAPGRCFRLLYSSKLCGSQRAPLLLNAARCTPQREEAQLAFVDVVARTLVSPAPAAHVTLDAPTVAFAPAPILPSSTSSTHVPAAPGAPALSRPAPPLTWPAWQARWRHVTAMPLLDMPRLAHPRVLTRRRGAGLPPAPFGALGRWGAAALARVGCARVLQWRYEESDWPAERLLHLTGAGGRCAHVGREHRSQNVMLTIDLENELAWLRCWDQQCVVRLCGGGYRKARAFVAIVPAADVLSQ